jgi:hypothetical protein
MKITREKFRIASNRLLRVIQAPNPLDKDVIEAAENFAMLELALMQAEIANGMYKKPLDAIVKEHRYDPLPDEVRAVIIASWKRGGLLPAATVEQMAPKGTQVVSVPVISAS